MTKHTLLTTDETLRDLELIRERLGHDRHLKIIAAPLTAKSEEPGTFTGYASTFGGEPDLQGDIVVYGAFTRSIRDWRARGSWPSLLWNHDKSSPAAVLGVITDMRQDDRGLLVAGKLDLDHEPALEVYKAMKSGRISTFSFAYAIVREHRRDDGVNVLDELDVLDVTITATPANRSAQLVSIKSADENDPRRVPTELAQVKRRIDAVLGTPTEPVLSTDPAVVRGEIDAVLGPKPIDYDAIERFVEEQREARKAEEAKQQHQREWETEMRARARAMSQLSSEDERERDRERLEREQAEREARWREREVEAARLEEVDRQRREWTLNDPNVYTP